MIELRSRTGFATRGTHIFGGVQGRLAASTPVNAFLGVVGVVLRAVELDLVGFESRDGRAHTSPVPGYSVPCGLYSALSVPNVYE